MTDANTYRAFRDELTKIAISAGTTLSLLQQRAAQGARIAPKLMQSAEHAAATGLVHTPSSLRQTALGAGEAVRASQASSAALQNPVTQGMRQRVLGAYERSMSGGSGIRDTSKMLPSHYDYGATGMAEAQHAYTPEHINSMMGTGVMHDPQGILASTGRRPSMMQQTPPMGASAATRVTGPKAGATNPTGPTVIAPNAGPTRVTRQPIARAATL